MKRNYLLVIIAAISMVFSASCGSSAIASNGAPTQLNEKASKDARKEAKRLKSDKWEAAPGALPIEKQLDKSYAMQYQYDDNGYPKYIMAEAMSIGESYDAAKFQAQELARLNIAGSIQTEVASLIESTIANDQLAAEKAASIAETLGSSKTLIAQRIGRLITVVEVYRTLENKNKEVLIRYAYSKDLAFEAAKGAIKENLKAQGNELHDELDAILGL